MELRELQDILETGTKFTVTCKKGIEDIETSLDKGMKGYIISVREEWDNEDVIILDIDMTDFVEYNDPLMEKNFYDENGVPCLTAKEADCYPKDNIETIYMGVVGFGRWFDRYFDYKNDN